MIQKTWKTASIALLVALTAAVSGCGNNGGNDNNGKQAASGTSAAATGTAAPSTDGGATQSAAASAEQIDPLGKYDPPIDISTVVISDPTMKFENGDSVDNNPYYRAYEKELGIKVKNLWVVDQSQRDQKINLAISSGDIPDIMHVDAKQLQLLYNAGKLADLTDVYDKYATPFTKQFLTVDGGYNLGSGKFDGKLMAIPETQSYLDGAFVLWVRTDWLKKLNLPEPQSMEDVIAVAEAFANDDPDGNNKKDTIGLALTKDVFAGYAGAEGLFYGYGAYPGTDIWIKGADGSLVSSNIQPEVKNGLAELQKLFKEGVIDPEFGVKDVWKASESAVAGKNGLFFGTMANSFQLQPGKEKDPQMEWKALPIPAIGGGLAKVVRPKVTNTGYYVVSKEMKHPEAAIKLLNLFLQKQYSDTPDKAIAIDPVAWKLSLFRPAPAAKNYDNYKAVREALQSGDESKLNLEQQGIMKNIAGLKAGKITEDNNWAMAMVFGENSSYEAIDQYVQHDSFVLNEFYGTPTPTMLSKGSALNKLTTETFTKIIMNRAPIDEFDSFVKKWKATGGDDITKEINDWYASQNK